MESVKQPLSPHLQIYRPQITSVFSITHRATGVFLSLGALLFSVWLVALAGGEQRFNAVQAQLGAWYGKILLAAFVFALYYHLCNGVRHLFWDMGLGLDLPAAYRSAYVTLGMASALTLLTLGAGWLA